MKQNWLKIIIAFFSALFFILLDTSFFSAMTINDAQIIISFIILVILALGASDMLMIFSFFVVIFFAIFSSLPVWVIVVNFMVLPSVLFYLRKKFLPEPSFFSLPLYFIGATGVFEMVLIFYSREFSGTNFLTLLYFIVLNSLSGLILYVLTKIPTKAFRSGEIRI